MNYCALILISCCLIFSHVFAQECTKTSQNHEQYMGTKTPYRFVANQNDAKVKYEGCVPVKSWMLIRHGTRTPSRKLIVKMKEHLPGLRDRILQNNLQPNEIIRNSDLDAFRKWDLKLEEADVQLLTHEGEDEMLGLAERMQSRFPSVFPSVYSNTSYFFKYTATSRTRASARYFAAGLFGRQTVKDVWFPKPSKQDPVLRFYKLCSKWKNEMRKSPAATEDTHKFDVSIHMRRAVSEISRRLNMLEPLTLYDVQLMHNMCAFETAWNKRKMSPWCAPFTAETLKPLEFAEDLRSYWKDSYSYELTYKQACVAFRDMVTHFKSKLTYPKTVAYFTHSGTLTKMIAHLGLYKDPTPLRHTDFANSNRKWRTSKIDSFGTNLAFILHNCGSEQKLLFLHQEHVMRLPSCPDSDLCSIKTIEKYYDESITECDFDEMCDNDNDEY